MTNFDRYVIVVLVLAILDKIKPVSDLKFVVGTGLVWTIWMLGNRVSSKPRGVDKP